MAGILTVIHSLFQLLLINQHNLWILVQPMKLFSLTLMVKFSSHLEYALELCSLMARIIKPESQSSVMLS